jgi:hypothetical protein
MYSSMYSNLVAVSPDRATRGGAAGYCAVAELRGTYQQMIPVL